MKRNLVGLACVISSATAGAQTSGITLYGVADANIEYTNNNASTGPDGHSRVGLNSGGLSPSRWGLRGTEDLGGGMQAIFALESGFSLDTGVSTQGGRLFGRQAWVGLRSGEHRLTVGRQYTSLFLIMANYSPTAYATTYEPVLGIAGSNLREDNMVKYHVDVGPLTAQAHWSFGEQPGTIQGSSAYGAGFDYRIGQFGVAGAYDSINGALTAGNYTRTQKAALGLRYQIAGPARPGSVPIQQQWHASDQHRCPRRSLVDRAELPGHRRLAAHGRVLLRQCQVVVHGDKQGQSEQPVAGHADGGLLTIQAHRRLPQRGIHQECLAEFRKPEWRRCRVPDRSE